MANWDKTTDETGREFIEINGELYPSQTCTPSETLRDPDGFQKKIDAVHEEYLRKNAESIAILSKVIIPGTVNRY